MSASYAHAYPNTDAYGYTTTPHTYPNAAASDPYPNTATSDTPAIPSSARIVSSGSALSSCIRKLMPTSKKRPPRTSAAARKSLRLSRQKRTKERRNRIVSPGNYRPKSRSRRREEADSRLSQ